MAFDGKRTTIYTPSSRTARVEGEASAEHYSAVVGAAVMHGELFAMHRAGTYRQGEFGLRPSSITYSEPVIVGRQVVDGTECTVVEQRQDVKLPSCQLARVVRFWVCRAKGYAVLRGEVQSEGPSRALVRWDTRVRPCRRGLWTPVRAEHLHYADPRNGRRTLLQRTVSTLGPDFQFDLPTRKLNLSLRLPRGTKVHDEVLKKD